LAEVIDHLAQIVQRKHHEVGRRQRRAAAFERAAQQSVVKARDVLGSLRRAPSARPHVIAEIKLRSPSAGQIRPRAVGEIVRIAQGYERAGASAVSVLCDRPGFGSSALDLRRVSSAITAPVLFKEFVLHEVQLDLARAVSASLVLLLVRVLDDRTLARLITACRRRGMEAVVEAADAEELERALGTDATIVGINARDLRSFSVDAARAHHLVECIPADRIAVFMSGVRSRVDFARVTASRADAVLIGEGLMRAADPGAELAHLLSPD
jgi:indole-3-glycerol phosphate synthase